MPIADSAMLSIKLLKHGTLKTYEGLPHGMLATHPERLNPDLLRRSSKAPIDAMWSGAARILLSALQREQSAASRSH